MIDERELYGLADPGVGPAPAWPAVAAVLERGTRLRRRRHAVRSAGVGTMVVGVIGAGFVAAGRGSSSDDAADVAIGDQSTTTDVSSNPPPPPAEDCEIDREEIVLKDPVLVDPADVPDAMRVLPAWLPNGEVITDAHGSVPGSFGCEGTAPADDALVLRSLDGAGVVNAKIYLSGPLVQSRSDMVETGEMTYGSGVSHNEVPFRGGTAVLVDGRSVGGDFAFDWKDADGWSWELRGSNVDEATLRAVGEALVLDSAPEGEDPVAGLAQESLPSGFEIAWQALGPPVPFELGEKEWTVVVGQGGTPAHVQCMIGTSEKSGNMPIAAAGGVGASSTTVNGHAALWGTGIAGQGNALTWEISPGILASAGCVDWREPGIQSLPIEDVVRFAESIAPVAADDPRIPVPAP